MSSFGKTELPAATLQHLLLLNRLRRNADSEAAPGRLVALEAEFEQDFSASCNLAVYGSLAPGRINHHVMAGIPGQWIEGLSVRGRLIEQGWGAAAGFPALKWMMDGPEVSVSLFVSVRLPEHWSRLDEFEGAEYRRILAPIFRAQDFITIANIYEASSLIG